MNTDNVAANSAPFDLERLIGWCARTIVAGVDYGAYASAFLRVADTLFPPPPAGNLRDDPQLRRRLALAMARAVWRQMPHPAHRFASAPLPLPERNAPCHCGSGRKYKQCCQILEQGVPLRDMNLLPMLLDALPRKRWGELVGSRIAVDMITHAAREWTEEGRAADSQALLEPWFVDTGNFMARYEAMFDCLLDAYTELRKPRKKAALLERGLAHGDRSVRSAALQRRVTMLADAGDHAAAWALFGEAQRHEPDSVSLSHLEITLLLSEGRGAEARERAHFWLRRLERRRDPELADLLAFLREVANEGGAAMLRLAADRDPLVGEFLELWRNAPPIAVHYTLKPHGDSAGPLQPTSALRAALAQWRVVAEPIAHSPLQHGTGNDMWATASAWLPVLRRQPLLWHAFEVLDSMLRAMEQIPVPGSDELIDGLLERSESLLREVLRANTADALKLEWGWLENRPALYLVGERLTRESDEPPNAAHLARLDWLVRTLNPNDNQGFRMLLMRRYLELARYAEAVALADLYPDDFAEMRYNRALALFAMERPGDAMVALREAAGDSPKLLRWLLKDKAKEPRLDPLGVTVGGDDEAWLYRRQYLVLWQRLGALDWARRFAGAHR